MFVSMATIQLFSIILKTRISIVFQVFPTERGFPWDNLCFGHHNTLRSLIEAHIRTVTVEDSGNLVCPTRVIDTKPAEYCCAPQSNISILCHINLLSGSVFVFNFFSLSSGLSFVVAPVPTFTAFGGNCERLNIHLGL